MGWNPSPKVAVAREVAQKLKVPIVIITAIFIDFDGSEPGKLKAETISYGENGELCLHAKELADVVHKALTT